MTTPFVLQDAMADQLAIAQLVYRFENAFDAGDLEGHMATWAEEMSFESPFGSYQDRQAYREWVRQFIEQTKAMGGTRHLINNAEIEVDGDMATMFCYLTILNQQKRSIMLPLPARIRCAASTGSGSLPAGCCTWTKTCPYWRTDKKP
jgi:ketosteroid isomerase-like protein